jgi:hypothetical protein
MVLSLVVNLVGLMVASMDNKHSVFLMAD